MRTPEEDDLSEECICEPPQACLCCHRPPEMVERDLLCAYQGSRDTTKGEESVEDHLPTFITQGASNLHSDEDMEDKIKLLDPRLQTLIRTYLEVFGVTRSRGGPGYGTLRWTRTSKQAGKALRSQGYHHARVM